MVPTDRPLTPGGHRWAWSLALAALASVVLRLRFLAGPLGVDEAGAVTVAEGWDRGARLYVDLFIDRPQGMLVAIQRWIAVFGDSATSLRLLAAVAGVAVVLGAGVAARALSGSARAGATAAWLVAVISSSAAIEGYAANGELLAGACTVPAFAIGALAITRRARAPWMLAAGLLAGAGLAVKQSGFDVALALGLWLVVAAWRRWRTPGEVAALLGWLVLGVATVAAALAVHGATLGWDDYAYAMWGFRVHARSVVAGAQPRRLAITLLVAAPLVGPALAAGAWRLRSLDGWRARVRPEHLLVAAWAAVAVAGFLAGGNYHRHYWIQLTFPLGVGAALAMTAGMPAALPDRPGPLLRPLALALALPLAISLVVIADPRLERDPRVDRDRALATWYQEHRRSPGDDLLPLCASVTFFTDVDRQPPYPYLWVDHVRSARGAQDKLIALLDGPDRPAFVALHHPLQRCDPTGRIEAVLRQRYRRVAVVDGVPVLTARRSPP